MLPKFVEKCVIAIFVGIWISLFAGNLYASTYYIDFESGVDSNNGTSFSTPFKHSPGDANATATAGATTLSPGDTVYFKGGVVYNGDVVVSWSGSAGGGDITYDGNSAENWGTGKAIIDGLNDVGTYTNAFTGGSEAYITINYFEIREFGGYIDGDLPSGDCTSPISTPRSATAIDFTSGANHLTITNNYIHEIGIWQNQPPFAGAAINGNGIYLQEISDVTIDNNTITKMHTGMGFKSSGGTVDSITVSNNDISWVVWGVDVAPKSTGSTFSNLDFDGNAIHDYEEYDLANFAGCGADPHSDGIFIRCDYDYTTFLNINIHNNTFYSTYAGGGGTAAIYLSYGPSANIYNNIFLYPLKGRVVYIGNPPRPNTSDQIIRVYNNSFLTANTDVGIANGNAKRTLFIKNNIFFDSRTSGAGVAVHAEFATSNPTELDNNQYYKPYNTSNRYVVRTYDSGWSTLPDIRTKKGWEINGAYADPLYLNISFGSGTSTFLNDLRLRTGSPAINSGLDFSELFSTDKNETLRPIGLFWDKGAFEFFGDSISPKSPTNDNLEFTN